MKRVFFYCFLIIFNIWIWSCNEGTDASLLNNVNELIITGRNSADFDFNHFSTEMIVHLYDNSDFTGVPEKVLTLKFTDTDEQQNVVAVNETTVNFLDAISPGDYYANAFIDLNGNSKIDSGEPYAIWLNTLGKPKVIEVREESRWKILFDFVSTY